jgi:hypothetical protein
MSRFLDEVTEQMNLRWAWEKVRREARPGDIWFDEIELAGFELELERNLQNIAAEFRKGRYHLTPIRPLPFPKHSDKDGNPQLRQMFEVALRDQVAWTAVVNVVGPYVDSKMPAWSYGNRLYRSIWVEEDDTGLKRRKIGRYRHSTGRLYLPFGQSWPIFRRHVYLATRAMTKVDGLPEMDERTKEEMDLQEQLAAEHRCPFVMPHYWQGRRPGNGQPYLYWCSFDLEKFYPTLKLRIVKDNILEHLPGDWRNEASQLLESMLRFRLDLSDWADDDLQKMNIKPERRTFYHIPTGLYVAGFLANAGLLKIDTQINKRLAKTNVAHFRFVDDHIVLAYSFDELVKWLQEYRKLLDTFETGAKINPEKVEPKELAQLFAAEKRKWKPRGAKYVEVQNIAEKACRLDPQFPSPLMTKTLALVSGIARTNFNLLEPAELEAMTDQLEQLLLVDLPEKEMLEKTRLSFAATRLTRIAECRLANDEPQSKLLCELQVLDDKLTHTDLADDERQHLKREQDEKRKVLTKERNRLECKVSRAFQLLRKVLREHPDRIRLWTRAVLMCRLTGVNGLSDLLADIAVTSKTGQMDPLAVEYLHSNMLALLGSQILVAARILRDKETAHWRKQAARSFIEDVIATKIETPDENTGRRFLRVSWQQYCFGVYCAGLVLKDKAKPSEMPPEPSFPEALLVAGDQCVVKGSVGHSPAQWAWWAGRMTLRDLAPHANALVEALGRRLKPSREATAFWRFFPLDVPIPVLRSMTRAHSHLADSSTLAGWWFDVLREREETTISSLPAERNGVVRRVKRVLSQRRQGTVSLYEWCVFLLKMSIGGSTDPRAGEWTALDIIRQIAGLVSIVPTFGVEYIKSARRGKDRFPWIHPANFRVPKEWLKEGEMTWPDWQKTIRQGQRSRNVVYVPKLDRIVDRRYTPLNNLDSPSLFVSVNPVRGLGLLLYGLLKKSFDLPAMWNGPGHADVLGMLPRLLLENMSYSSWTLGVLQGCLQPRVTENLYLKTISLLAGSIDDDTLRDPVAFSSAQEVVMAVQKCQDVLVKNQLSTLDHKARQLTPISIRQLTEPEWIKVFSLSEGASADE